MRSSRYAKSRQKACQQCSSAKVRCDQQPDGCSRCLQRGLWCNYMPSVPSKDLAGTQSIDGDAEQRARPSSLDAGFRVNGSLPDVESGASVNDHTPLNNLSTTPGVQVQFPDGLKPETIHHVSCDSGTPDILDFSNLELSCPINADDIGNRWLHAYIPIPGQKVKQYPTNVTAYIYRILKSYTAVAIYGRGIPPFVHESQMRAATTSPSLSTCLSLVRICQKPLRGSEDVAVSVLQQEMSKIYELRGTSDISALLATFQAYLIYATVLYFQLGQGSNSCLREAMMNLQELACATSRQGLVCIVDQQRSRPRWEAWIVAEAKRRTLYTMYLFDSVLSALDGLPTYLGSELQGLPAPSSKPLWQAQERTFWEKEYNLYLVDWTDEGLRIDELWPAPPELDEDGVTDRRSRVDKWLEQIDEYGTMLYAVTCCTHGG